mgnify:CR=1 FL=1
MGSMVPVTKLPCVARKKMTAATSSGVPTRPSGCRDPRIYVAGGGAGEGRYWDAQG